MILNRLVTLEPAWKAPDKAPRLVRGLARVGLFSYSLYLTHEIIITYFSDVFSRWCGIERNSLFLLALTPLCVALAWLFFQLFERPFVTGSAPVPSPRIIPAPQGLRVTPI